ncbi:hypothetical protein MBLNU459_g3812t1 [Dothideomycetes sp. NU459]
MLFTNVAQFVGLFLLSSTTPASASAIPERRATSATYLSNAHAAITRMQQFYNTPRPGYWTNGWWNSAQCLTLLADLRQKDSSTFLTSITDGPNGVFQHTLASQNRDSTGALAWDDYFDDQLWWVMALLKTYDVTGNRTFLTVANETFTSVSRNDAESTPCGGLYNSYPQQTGRVASSTIATVLYVEAAAMLATRIPSLKSHFISLAETQWNWVSKNLLINGIIQGDSLAGSTCTNNHAFLTYIEGVAISATVWLYDATGQVSWLNLAETLANNTMSGKFGMVNNGIVTEFCDASLTCNPDIAQFKGILMRGLKMLAFTKPSAVGGTIPAFIKKNADSIWANSRGSDNLLGEAWAGPFNRASDTATQLASHSSATMALVMAAVL